MTRRVSSRVAARSLVLVLIGLPAWSQNPDPEICAQPNYTTGLFTCNGTDCLPEGLGAHPVLNRLKNRDVLPIEFYPTPFSIKDIVDSYPSHSPSHVRDHCTALIAPDPGR